jgi:hypothetical protein
VLLVHGDALADGVETLLEDGALDAGNAHRGPLAPHVLGGAERECVVDDRAAAEAGAGEQADAAVVRGDATGVHVQP